MKKTWKNNNTLRESILYNGLYRDGELSELYEKLKNAIGASNLCDEIATHMDIEELRGLLNHISIMYQT